MAVFLISWTESEIEIMSSVIQHSTFQLDLETMDRKSQPGEWRLLNYHSH